MDKPSRCQHQLSLSLARLASFALFWTLVFSCVASGQEIGKVDSDSKNRESEVLDNALFAGGCFWSLEADFSKLPGVKQAISGYSGGKTRHPTYKTYSQKGHREVVLIQFDPDVITYSGLVEFFLKHINPLDRGGSFVDRGIQYAPAIYAANEVQAKEAKEVIDAINAMQVLKNKINIDIKPRGDFWPAEAYHQDYAFRNTAAYLQYRSKCGRDEFVAKHWGARANRLELPQSLPQPKAKPNSDEGISTVLDSSKEETKSTKPWESFEKPETEELKKTLSRLQFRVTQANVTEPAFRNEFWDHHEAGIYVDVVSGEPLFSSTDKFESGTGWPSFARPIERNYLTFQEDRSEKTLRVEVRSRYGDSHLGHVFQDGPIALGGYRYCINSASLRFIPKDKLEKQGYGEYSALFRVRAP